MPGHSRDNHWQGICQVDFWHYLMVVGEFGGGVTGAPQDWQTLKDRESPALSRYGRGRIGTERHRVTVFYGGQKKIWVGTLCLNHNYYGYMKVPRPAKGLRRRRPSCKKFSSTTFSGRSRWR